MKKRIVSLFLVIVVVCTCVMAAGCSGASYEDIACEEYTSFKDVYFTENPQSDILSINTPKKWKYQKNDNYFKILEYSDEIGSVEFINGNKYENEGKQVFVDELEKTDVSITHTINKSGFGKKAEYTHTFIYEYEDSCDETKSIVVRLPYEKVDKNTASKLMNYAKTKRIHFDDCTGILQTDNGRRSILILGNSFIGSSSIHSTLQRMCGNSISVVAYSKGGAGVREFAEDPYILNEISNGKYAAVLMCGFYASIHVEYFGRIVDACEASDTKLAIFPAHNEVRGCIDDACSRYTYPVLIDWKNEIDLLIEGGIDNSYFRIDDYHGHSTPLAGYVGAHMAYRALFGEMPDENLKYEHVSSYQISLLGDYKTTARIYPAAEHNVNSFE